MKIIAELTDENFDQGIAAAPGPMLACFNHGAVRDGVASFPPPQTLAAGQPVEVTL